MTIDPNRTKVEVDGKRWPQVEVTIQDGANPYAVVIFLEHMGRDPAFLGFKVLSDGEDLEASSFARLARNLPKYVAYARARALLAEDRSEAIELLRREVSKARRGMDPFFLQQIAERYQELAAAGDPHPQKTIAEETPVDKSAVSRWMKQARELGFLDAA